jgi:uncharacterized membrane protein
MSFQMLNKINDWIALNLTLAMSSIWCVYGFLMIAIAPLFAPGLEQFCIYLSTTIIQLVALPAILVGSKLLAEQAEKRTQIQYDAVMETLGDVREDHANVASIVTSIQTMLAEEDTEVADLTQIQAMLVDIQASLKAGEPASYQ